jgi:ATP-dependent Clp protease protease subunit
MSGTGDIEVWINSPGGDCVAAAQIYNMLMDYKGNVTVKIDGIAASAASVIAMAGTKTLVSPTSLLMIHNPFTFAQGDADELQKAIEMLGEVKESIINAYELKTGLSRAKLSHLMDDETWLNANKAVELGFADEIMFSNKDDEDENDDEDDDVVVKEDDDDDTNKDDDDKDKDKVSKNQKSLSFSFSPKTSQANLISKIEKTKKINVNPVGAVDGNQLLKRLNLLRH